MGLIESTSRNNINDTRNFYFFDRILSMRFLETFFNFAPSSFSLTRRGETPSIFLRLICLTMTFQASCTAAFNGYIWSGKCDFTLHKRQIPDNFDHLYVDYGAKSIAIWTRSEININKTRSTWESIARATDIAGAGEKLVCLMAESERVPGYESEYKYTKH